MEAGHFRLGNGENEACQEWRLAPIHLCGRHFVELGEQCLPPLCAMVATAGGDAPQLLFNLHDAQQILHGLNVYGGPPRPVSQAPGSGNAGAAQTRAENT